MLIVLEIAPDTNGWAAAIIRICDSAERNRWPSFPQRLAQSKTGRCSGLRCGAPSTVIVPQTYLLASSICDGVKPKDCRTSKPGASICSLVKPIESVRMSSPMLQRLKAKGNSNVPGSCSSMRRITSSGMRLARRLDGLMWGQPTRVPAPRLKRTISSTCPRVYPSLVNAGGTEALMILK